MNQYIAGLQKAIDVIEGLKRFKGGVTMSEIQDEIRLELKKEETVHMFSMEEVQSLYELLSDTKRQQLSHKQQGSKK
jgi:hypothetical protein